MNISAFNPDNSWINFSSDMTDNDDLNFHLESLLQNISEAMNISEETITAYLNNQRTYLPSQRDALPLLATISIFYGFIFVAGILGNLITCIVISRNKSMHTATNYYLFNLAISDLILLLSGLPPDLYSMWYPMSYPFSDSICILESTLLETATNATVLTITAFSVERYIAICHPFRQHTMSKLSRAIKFILAIWVTAFILALPQAMQFSVISMNKEKICSVKNGFLAHVFAVSGCLFFVGPMTAICVLYVLIGIKLKKSKLLQGVKRYDLNRGISAQTRVIRMLIAVAVAFFLCWAPFHIQRLMAAYGLTLNNRSKLFQIVYDVMNYASGLMYFLSTCINPLLYNIMSHKFRNAFKLTLARQFGLTSRYQVQNNNYYSALTRQNGSMRLNMTILDNRSTNRTIGPLHKRESDSSLLADHSLVTRLSGSNRTPNRFRCVSVTSQSTLLTTLSKNDVFATNNQQQHPSQKLHHDHNNYSSSANGTRSYVNQHNQNHDDIQITTFDNDSNRCECGEHQKPRTINSNQYHQTKNLIPKNTLSSIPSVSNVSDDSINKRDAADDVIDSNCDDDILKSLKIRELNRSKQHMITKNNTNGGNVIDYCKNDDENPDCNNINNGCIASGGGNNSIIDSKTLFDDDVIVGYCDSNSEENEFSLLNLNSENNTNGNYGAERKLLNNDYHINCIPGTAKQIIVHGDGAIKTTSGCNSSVNYNNEEENSDKPTTPIMMERQRNNSKDNNVFNFTTSKNVLKNPITTTVGNLTEIFNWKNNKRSKTKLLVNNNNCNNTSTVFKDNKTIK